MDAAMEASMPDTGLVQHAGYRLVSGAEVSYLYFVWFTIGRLSSRAMDAAKEACMREYKFRK